MNDYIVYINSNKNIYDLNIILEREYDLVPLTILRNEVDKEKVICNNLYIFKENKCLINIILTLENLKKSELFKKSLTILSFNTKYMENITPILSDNYLDNYKKLEKELFN